MLLASGLSEELEVNVVVKNRQRPRLSGGGHERIHERECSMLSARGQHLLNLQAPSLVSIGHRDVREGQKSFRQREVVAVVTRREAEFESNCCAQSHTSCGGQWSERCCNVRLGEASEDARVSQILQARHLLLGSPRTFCGSEVEPPLLAEKRYQLEPALCMYDLS